MDDFQPEDELKPDTSDRPAPRGKKPAPSSKLPISKQHLMIAVGILVLLLLVLGIGSALNSPSNSSEQTTTQGSERNIDLAGNSPGASMDSTATQQPNDNPSAADTSPAPSDNSPQDGTADTHSMAAQQNPQPVDQNNVAALPVGAATLDRNAKLSNTAQVAQQPTTSVESTPPVHRSLQNEQHPRSKPTVVHNEPRQPSHRSEAHNTVSENRERIAHRQPVRTETRNTVEPKAPAKTVEKRSPVTTAVAPQPAKSVPAPVTSPTSKQPQAPVTSQATTSGKGYTLQLSGASREDTLNAWAKQQNLTGYQVYKTSRNGQAWYVLTTGNYKTPAEAKSAISSLPEAVKAKSPWVKPMSQVRKESAQ